MVTFPLAGMQFPWSGERAPIAPVARPRTVYDVAAPAPAPQAPAFVSNTPPQPPAPLPVVPPALPPNYQPGQPIPASDWFGICKQMKV